MSGIARAVGGTDDRAAGVTSGLAREQLRLALASLAPNAFVMPVFGAIVCALFSRWVEPGHLITWWLLVTLGGLPLGVVGAAFLRAPSDNADTNSWIRAATISHLTFAISWSSMALFLWVPGSDLNHMLLQLILAATLAGNMALSGACRSLTINGYAVHGLAFVVIPLRTGGATNLLVSALALLFVCYMIYMSTRIYQTARRMLMLADEKSHLLDEKNALIAELSRSKMVSERARFESDRANQAKTQFLANMSHELRTPLNAIIGFSELLRGGVVSGKTEEYAEIISRSGNHLLGLINDILDLSKIEAEQMALRESTFDLAVVIERCVSSMQARAASGALTLLAENPDGLHEIYADERSLRQILFNLISNAIKFTKPGGTVRVGAAILPDALSIYVRDTGVGIASQDLERVFESFGQGQHDVVNGDHGTGLGLPIVRGLARAHGGDVSLVSEVDQGTCVTVRLPLSRIRSMPLGSLGSVAAG